MLEELESWSEWFPLRRAGANGSIVAYPGLYRIRAAGREEFVYVGQTGNSLRGRLGMLAGVYAPEMPYSDPHTAAPALWALRDARGVDFEVSVTVVEGDAPWRKALECVAITRHRAEHGVSPLANFGRMPAGYRKSSGNNARLVLAGKRFRGGPDRAAPAIVTVPVPGPLLGAPASADWLGLEWSRWRLAADVVDDGAIRATNGLYRLRAAVTPDDVLYVGQGAVGTRVAAHLAKATKKAHRQASYFADTLEVSWVGLEWAATQRLEVENDCIAAHVLSTGRPPPAQFLG